MISFFGGGAAKAQSTQYPFQMTIAAHSLSEAGSLPIFRLRVLLGEDAHPIIDWLNKDNQRLGPFVANESIWSRKQLSEASDAVLLELTRKSEIGGVDLETNNPIEVVVVASIARGNRVEDRVVKSDVGTLMRFFAGLDRSPTEYSKLIRQSLETIPIGELANIRQWESLDVESLKVIHVLTDEGSTKFIPDEQ
jgi:hypothetical protein